MCSIHLCVCVCGCVGVCVCVCINDGIKPISYNYEQGHLILPYASSPFPPLLSPTPHPPPID